MNRYIPELIVVLAAIACSPKEETETTSAPTIDLEFTCPVVDALGDVFEWTAGDKIGIYATGGVEEYENVCHEANIEGSTVVFKSVGDPMKFRLKAMDFQAVYPYTSNLSGTSFNFAVPSEYQDAPKKSDLVLKASKEKLRLTSPDQKPDLLFTPVTALLKLNVSSGVDLGGAKSLTVSVDDASIACTEAEFDIKQQSFKLGGKESSSISLSFKTPFAISTEASALYIPVLPGSQGKTLTLSAVLVDGTSVEIGSAKLPSEGFKAGEVTTLNLRYFLPSQSLAELEPANTYIVSAPDFNYKFPVNVKGNGKARTFNWTDDQRTAGHNIKKSWSDEDLKLATAKVEVLWYDSPEHDGKCPIEIESLDLDPDGYAVFKTPSEFVEGNVVIAAYDGAGKIIWSWTIWAVEGYDPERDAVQVGTFSYMDRNLGAVAGTEVVNGDRDPSLAIGNYYQWGRKDPFPAAISKNSTGWGVPAHTPIASLKKSGTAENGKSYTDLIFTSDANENTFLLTSVLGDSFTPEQAMEESIKHPHKWMSSGTNAMSDAAGNYCWFNRDQTDNPADRPLYKHFWGNVDGVTTEKTIYDPCPPGWMVPPIDALALPVMFASPKASGYYYADYNLYFPNAGYRSSSSESHSGSISDARLLYLGSSSTNVRRQYISLSTRPLDVTSGTLGMGTQIRCVRKESTNEQISKAPQGPRCGLMGDSITEQWFPPYAIDEATNRGDPQFAADNNFVGKGKSGDTAWEMAARFMDAIITLDPQSISISAGMNDVANGDALNQTTWDCVYNMFMMASISYQYCGHVIIASCTPSDLNFHTGPRPELGKRLIDINDMLEPRTAEYGYTYANYFDPLKDDENNLKLEYSYGVNDRVHPNWKGYKVMEPVLLDAVERVFAK